MDDVARLTRNSDFSRFVAPGVDESVKRAALKKLFTDPHFNVMDGLDIYIDDYNIASPLSEAELRKMAQSEFLRLFEQDQADAERGHGQPRWRGAGAGVTVRDRRADRGPYSERTSQYPPMKTLICDCNRTMPLDAAALSRALGPSGG